MPEGLGHIQISKFNAEEVAGRAALPPSRGRALQLRTGQQFPGTLEQLSLLLALVLRSPTLVGTGSPRDPTC